MPNWCYTNIDITHTDKNKLKEFYDRIEAWTSKDYSENGFGTNWLGNVIGNSGVAEYNNEKGGFITSDGKNLSCRGSVLFLGYNEDGIIRMSQEDAWSPNLKLWKMVLDKYLPDATLIYTAEEPGCGIYETNNQDYEDKYIIDIYGDLPDDMNWESMYEASEETVIQFCQDALKTDETDITKLLEMVSDLDWVGINKWEHFDVEDYDE